MRDIKFSTRYPKTHPSHGEETNFVEKIWNSLGVSSVYSVYINFPKQLKDGSWQIPVAWRDKDYGPKFHTIRGGHRWKVGDQFNPKIWTGMPYRSKPIVFAPPITIVRTWDFKINSEGYWLNNRILGYDELKTLAQNDGLEIDDFECWFAGEDVFVGQVISWDKEINY